MLVTILLSSQASARHSNLFSDHISPDWAVQTRLPTIRPTKLPFK
jgi:hypothetical protein